MKWTNHQTLLMNHCVFVTNLRGRLKNWKLCEGTSVSCGVWCEASIREQIYHCRWILYGTVVQSMNSILASAPIFCNHSIMLNVPVPTTGAMQAKKNYQEALSSFGNKTFHMSWNRCPPVKSYDPKRGQKIGSFNLKCQVTGCVQHWLSDSDDIWFRSSILGQRLRGPSFYIDIEIATFATEIDTAKSHNTETFIT